jgi:opine dehydrogenase
LCGGLRLGAARESELDNRYLTEDVGYTMVLFTELGRAVGVPTPTMDAVIEIASVLLGRDFRREAPRTLASLGLGDLDAAGLAKL